MRRRLRASGSRPATRADHTTLSEYPAGRGGLPGPDTKKYQEYAAIAVCAGLADLCLTSLCRDRVSCRGEALVSCPRVQTTLPDGSPEPAKSPFRAQDGEGCAAWWRDGSGNLQKSEIELEAASRNRRGISRSLVGLKVGPPFGAGQGLNRVCPGIADRTLDLGLPVIRSRHRNL